MIETLTKIKYILKFKILAESEKFQFHSVQGSMSLYDIKPPKIDKFSRFSAFRDL